MFLKTEDEKMSMYIENNLTKDERIIIKAKKSWLYMLCPAFLLVLVLVLAIVAQVLVEPYTNPKGLYVQNQLDAIAREIDDELKGVEMDSEIPEEDLKNSGDDVLEIMEHYLGHRDKYTWNDYRKAALMANKELIEQDWEENSDRYIELLNAEGGFSNIVAKYGSFVYILIWGLFLCYVLFFLRRLIIWLSANLALTNKRVVGKIGVLRINTLDFHLDKIDHVQMMGTFFGNLFHYYSLKIVSVGGAGLDNNRRHKEKFNQFPGISNAQEFKDMATRAIELHAEEARKAQAEEIARAMGK